MINKKAVFRSYLEKLAEVVQAGDAREESFYGTLAELIWESAQATGRSQVQITVLPRPTEAGNPDFRVWDGQSRIVGYIEAKPPTEELLDRIEQSEQLQRYRQTFPNLILTNFLEFRLYREGQRAATAQLGRPYVLTALRQTPPVENVEAVWSLLDQFLGFSLANPPSAEALAVELAKRTRFLRQIVQQQLTEEIAANRLAERTAAGQASLAGFYEAFQKYLIGALSPEEFADLYAQTVTYGLFAARTRAAGGFSRRNAVDYIPHSVGVLRDLFRFISWEELPVEMAWIVEDIAEVLAAADVRQMMDQFYREGRGNDPVVHFYETFLAHYDPEERERRGVYYTPDPVVSYIVRSLHRLLKSHFGKADGLASKEVTLLDPAAGTMTFVARAAELAVQEFTEKYGAGARDEFIRTHILRNFYAFELMVAPYAVGHLKMAFFLEELGHRLQENERIPFYLTNTLDMTELEASRLPGLSSLAEESRQAGRVKRHQPILVILGNPPYSYHSSNQGEWIRTLIEDYKQIDGKPLGEKNPKGLQDDYVKFLRFAQWKIEQAGRGLVGMITNHSYLDNPTFRGMRRSLMQTFDEIYILNLHGNSLKRERSPDGGPDENVFDIRQGVAIALFVKLPPGRSSRRQQKLLYTELWGLRDQKSEWLASHDVQNTPWKVLRPEPEFYFFVPRQTKLLKRYNHFLTLPDIFPVRNVGVLTARDKLTIHWTREQVWNTVLHFSRLDPEQARKAYGLGKNISSKRIQQAQNDLKETGPSREYITPMLYRPFDIRYTYYTGKADGFHERPRPEIMGHMLGGPNLGLVAPKRVEMPGGWRHALATDLVVEHVAVSLKTVDYLFPLYLYPDGVKEKLLKKSNPGADPQANLNPKLVAALTKAYHQQPTPEKIFYYVYAVLYTPGYRERYGEFLRTDFPRIPFPKDREDFEALAGLGRRLVDLHLLRSAELDPPSARFEGKGPNRVEKGKHGLRYDPETQRVFINQAQYFAPVPLEVWEYPIGGYQVCAKWLKDRQDRQLSLDEIRPYCQILTALGKTIAIQEEIDDLYSRVEEAILEVEINCPK